MVNPQYEAAEKIISSPSYNQVVKELIANLKITVDDEYEFIFAKLDAARVDRSGLSAQQIVQAVRKESESITKSTLE
jgi:predicted AAA+ superfamily ATPase